MRLTWKDGLATLFVAAGVVFFVLWSFGWTPESVNAATVAAALLILGVAASISAVVPGWDELLRAPVAYIAVTSALGLVALGTGVLAVAESDAAMLLALAVATIALWALATARHLGVPHMPQVRPGHQA